MTLDFVATLKSLLLFAMAGLAEIGGGYLVWQWLREGKALWIGIVGGAVLFLYGVIPTCNLNRPLPGCMLPTEGYSSCSRSVGYDRGWLAAGSL